MTKSWQPYCWDHLDTSIDIRDKYDKTTFKVSVHNIEGGSVFTHNFTVCERVYCKIGPNNMASQASCFAGRKQ